MKKYVWFNPFVEDGNCLFSDTPDIEAGNMVRKGDVFNGNFMMCSNSWAVREVEEIGTGLIKENVVNEIEAYINSQSGINTYKYIGIEYSYDDNDELSPYYYHIWQNTTVKELYIATINRNSKNGTVYRPFTTEGDWKPGEHIRTISSDGFITSVITEDVTMNPVLYNRNEIYLVTDGEETVEGHTFPHFEVEKIIGDVEQAMVFIDGKFETELQDGNNVIKEIAAIGRCTYSIAIVGGEPKYVVQCDLI